MKQKRFTTFLALGAGSSFEGKTVFTTEDIENAFNAGRDSVINNIALSWEGGYYSSTIFNVDYKIIYSPVSKEYGIMFDEEWLDLDFPSKNDAKQAADKDYKQRLKQALGL